MKEDKKSSGGIIFIILIIAVVFIFNNKKDELTEEKIKEFIPQEVTNYYFNDKECISTVENVKIDKQDTDNGITTTYCEIELKDENITRVAYICLKMKNYSKGGWNVENFTAYQEETLKEWKEESAKKFCENELGKLGYTGLILSSNSLSNENNKVSMNFDYSVVQTHTYLILSGNVNCKTTLKSVQEGVPIYPLTYKTEAVDRTSINIDTSGVIENWTIDGTWRGNIDHSAISRKNEVVLNIANSFSKTINWNATITTDWTFPKDRIISQNQGTLVIPDSKGTENRVLNEIWKPGDTNDTKDSEIKVATKSDIVVNEMTGEGNEYHPYKMYLILTPDEVSLGCDCFINYTNGHSVKLEKIQ